MNVNDVCYEFRKVDFYISSDRPGQCRGQQNNNSTKKTLAGPSEGCGHNVVGCGKGKDLVCILVSCKHIVDTCWYLHFEYSIN